MIKSCIAGRLGHIDLDTHMAVIWHDTLLGFDTNRNLDHFRSKHLSGTPIAMQSRCFSS